MRVIFAGAGSFALRSLEALALADVELLRVITRPDRPKGRGRRLAPTPVAEKARELGLSVVKPDTIGSLAEELSHQRLDLLIVADYGEMVPEKILRVPRLGAYNLHGSLLPRWRGAAPSAWAVRAGDQTAGVTCFKMVKRLDAGPILCRREAPIFPSDTAGFLEERLACVAAVLLEEALPLLRGGAFTLREQDPAQVTFAPKLSKEDGLIPWEEDAEAVARHVRAMQPWPRAFSFFSRSGWQRMNILKARAEAGEGGEAAPGTVAAVSGKEFAVACGKGTVSVERLQLAGRKAMTSADFLRGHAVCTGDAFTNEPSGNP